jgi:hypothetical protein
MTPSQTQLVAEPASVDFNRRVGNPQIAPSTNPDASLHGEQKARYVSGMFARI